MLSNSFISFCMKGFVCLLWDWATLSCHQVCQQLAQKLCQHLEDQPGEETQRGRPFFPPHNVNHHFLHAMRLRLYGSRSCQVTPESLLPYITQPCLPSVYYLMMHSFCTLYYRSKNTVNILIKNWLDMCIGALVYWALGFGFTFGESKGRFLGASYFFFANMPGKLSDRTTIWQHPIDSCFLDQKKWGPKVPKSTSKVKLSECFSLLLLRFHNQNYNF